MAITNITKNHDPKKINFWEINPLVQYIEPFSKLRDLKNGSDYMWAVFLLCDPDEDVNVFYRYSLEKRKEHILNLFPKLNLDDELFLECVDAYPFHVLNSIERLFKSKLDSLKARSKLLDETSYTLDYTDPDTGKNILGTAKQLDTMHKATDSIMRQFEDAYSKFKKEKAEEIKALGGRKLTASEKGLV